VLLFIGTSCSQDFGEFPFESQRISQYSKVITIPKQGCSGCISGATDYVITTIDSLAESNVAVVFTDINDTKELRLILGEEVLEKSNLYIDKVGVIATKFPSIYPQVFEKDKSKIISRKIFEN
jgi:hypothetical protein